MRSRNGTGGRGGGEGWTARGTREKLLSRRGREEETRDEVGQSRKTRRETRIRVPVTGAGQPNPGSIWRRALRTRGGGGGWAGGGGRGGEGQGGAGSIYVIRTFLAVERA